MASKSLVMRIPHKAEHRLWGSKLGKIHWGVLGYQCALGL